jgi:hypothetical protein
VQQTVRTFEMNSSQGYLQFLQVIITVILSYIRYTAISLNLHATDNRDLFWANIGAAIPTEVLMNLSFTAARWPYINYKLRGFSPQANYTDRAIAAGQRS